MRITFLKPWAGKPWGRETLGLANPGAGKPWPAGQTRGRPTASGPANLAPGITAKPGSGHTIYDTFDDEKRVI